MYPGNRRVVPRQSPVKDKSRRLPKKLWLWYWEIKNNACGGVAKGRIESGRAIQIVQIRTKFFIKHWFGSVLTVEEV